MNLIADTAYKRIYGHAFMLAELLRLLLPDVPGGRRLLADLDLTAARRQPEQSVDAQGHRRHGDMVWSVPFLPGAARRGRRLVVFAEFQEPADPLMPLRLRHYVSGHFVAQADAGALRAPEPVPPALGVVLHSGARRWNAPRTMAGLRLPGGDAGWRADLSSESSELFSGDGHLLLDSAALTPADGREDNAAWLLAALEGPHPAHVERWLGALVRRLGPPAPGKLRDEAVEWALRTLGRRTGLDLGVATMAEVARLQADDEWDEYLKQWRIDWQERYFDDMVAIGRAEGVAQGLADGVARERALLVRQVEARFGSEAAAAVGRRLDGIADPARLERIGLAVVSASPDADILAMVDASA